MTNFANLRNIANKLVDVVEEKDRDYGSSWRRRGGPGAFMVMARKWDRIENLVQKHGWDIFDLLDKNTGGAKDDVQDLVGYLLLILEHADPVAPPEATFPGDRNFAPLEDLSEYERLQPRYIHSAQFLCEGGWGDGTNLYTCQRCGCKVWAKGLVQAAQEHGECAGRGYVAQAAT